ncbi:MAG: SUF system NifU family Fe-S cluster assembly protein [Rhodospirillales bacterium]
MQMDDLKTLYQSVILDHSRNPRNAARPEGTTHQARGYNPLCGDQVTVYLALSEGVVVAAGFEGKGCALCLASASLMTERLAGADAAKLESLMSDLQRICSEEAAEDLANPDEILPLLPLGGVRHYPVRIKCVTLPWQAAKAALTGAKEATTE